MKNKKEIFAGIIVIGNEILSGRTKDTNTSTLSIWLNSLGIFVSEVRVIPDDEKKIINTVNELRNKFNYVFTTGGIGPTHDDITAESVSKAFNIEPNKVSILAYDALGLIYYCWVNNNFEFNSSQLYTKKGFKGLHGKFVINDNISKHELAIYKVSEKKFVKAN